MSLVVCMPRIGVICLRLELLYAWRFIIMAYLRSTQVFSNRLTAAKPHVSSTTAYMLAAVEHVELLDWQLGIQPRTPAPLLYRRRRMEECLFCKLLFANQQARYGQVMLPVLQLYSVLHNMPNK